MYEDGEKGGEGRATEDVYRACWSSVANSVVSRARMFGGAYWRSFNDANDGIISNTPFPVKLQICCSRPPHHRFDQYPLTQLLSYLPDDRTPLSRTTAFSPLRRPTRFPSIRLTT